MAKFDKYTAIGCARWAGITKDQLIEYTMKTHSLTEKQVLSIRQMCLDQYLDNLKDKDGGS